MVADTKPIIPYKERGKYGVLLHGNGCILSDDCFLCPYEDCIAKEREIADSRKTLIPVPVPEIKVEVKKVKMRRSWSKTQKKHLSEKAKEQWRNPEIRARMREAMQVPHQSKYARW